MTILTVSAPYLAMSRRICSAAFLLAAILARRSRPTRCGSRERRTQASATSRCSTPPRTTFSGGVGTASPNTSCADGLNEPGRGPPRSTWCAMAVVQPNSLPSWKIGARIAASFWCSPPPIHGSLQRNMSPSAMPGLSLRLRSVQTMARSIEPIRPMLYVPTCTCSPSSSQMEKLKSLDSVTTCEPDIRRRVSPISWVMAQSRCRTTS